ncbi:hypothetical protein LY76DRAFT_681909 [Colletotrichum caudatum]|nr:hypothetical protein LY76DRAFT_681909 [Colletotrichum caudatum]
MAIMMGFLAASLMTLVAVSNPEPVHQGHGAASRIANDFICAFSESPLDNAICYEVKLDNGKCKAVFINSKASKLGFNTIDVTISAGINVKKSLFAYSGGLFFDADEGRGKDAIATVDTAKTVKIHKVTIGEGTTSHITKRLFFDRSDIGQKVYDNESVAMLTIAKLSELLGLTLMTHP